eukprot:scaffold303283_cov41-Prasinocladus_malaysianus.AAC.1
MGEGMGGLRGELGGWCDRETARGVAIVWDVFIHACRHHHGGGAVTCAAVATCWDRWVDGWMAGWINGSSDGWRESRVDVVTETPRRIA